MSGVFKAVSNVVSGVVNAIGSVVNGVVSAVGSVVSGVINFVLSPFLGLFGAPSAPDTGNQAQTIQGVTVQREGGNVSIPIIYGYRKVGGIVTFCETGSDNNKYLWVAYVLSEGPVEGLRELWINDIQIGASNIPNLNNGNLVTISDDASGKLKGRVQLQFARGDQYNVGSAVKSGIFAGSPSWTESMRYTNLSVVFARYEWVNATDQATADANPFTGNIPKLQVSILGRKVRRLTTTNISTTVPEWGTNADRAAWVYSSNPADIMLDYMRSNTYGKGLKSSDVDWDSFKTTATKFDQTVTYVSGVTGPIHTLHAVVDTSQTIFNNIKLMLQQCRGYMPYSRLGTFKLRVEDAGNPSDILSGSAAIVATFNKDNIQGPITYTGIERTAKYNQVTVTYCDPDQQWSQQTITVPDPQGTEFTTYLAQDGNRLNKGDFTFAWVTNYAMAQSMARLILLKSRYQDTLSFTASSQALELEVGDNIYVDANILKFGTDPAQDAIPWRIVSSKINNDYTVAIGCVRNPDFIYPYVRVNERDYKFPVYIPKGASRYYPKEPIGIPVGLNPPTYAPTDPADLTNPPQTPGIGVLIDVISIYDVSYVYSASFVTATIRWTNPGNALATSINFTTSAINSNSVLDIQTVNISGASGSIVIQNLLKTTGYFIVAVVQYSTGDRSTKKTQYSFTTGSDATTTPVVPGIPAPPGTPPVNNADNFFKTVTGATVTSGSYPNQIPLSPRQVAITVTQDITNGSNSYLTGLQVFYKPSNNTKWFVQNQTLSGIQGQPYTFNITVGPRQYPNTPSPSNSDAYDFIFRYTYSDGKNSKWQFRAMNQVVEWSGLTYAYNLFVAGMTSGQSSPTVILREDSTAYIPQIAGPNDLIETRYIQTPVYSVREYNTGTYSSPTNQGAILFVKPPIASERANWVGVRVYRHKAGVAGTGDSVDFTPATFNTVGGTWTVTVPGISFNDIWEFVIVDLVYYGASTVEAFNGQYISGYVHNRTADADYPGDSNWYSKFTNYPTEALASAKARIGSAAAAPVRNDTYFDSISAITVLTSGQPSTPRTVSFTVKTSTVNGANNYVSKVRIYYKQSSNLYWKTAEYAISAENTNITFNNTQMTPAMDLGYRSYPNDPIRADDYDLQFRITYTDGTASKYVTKYTAVSVEKDPLGISGYNFNPLSNSTFNSQTIWTALTLEENAPPGSLTDPRTLVLAPGNPNYWLGLSATTDSGVNNATFSYTLPSDDLKPYFIGVRIYQKDTSIESNTKFTQNDSNQPLTILTTDTTTGFARQAVVWDTIYEYVITPLVWYNGAITPCNNSWYWKGAIHDRTTQTVGTTPYPSNGDWYSKLAPTLLATNVALGTLEAAIPVVDPTVKMISMIRVQPSFGATPATDYYQIKFKIPASITSVDIYRRSTLDPKTNPSYWNLYANPYYSNMYGAGRWEKFTLSGSNSSTDGATGITTVNLRYATNAGEFSAYYDPTVTVGAKNSFGMNNYLYANGTSTAPTVLALNTAGNQQILIVGTYSAGVSGKAVQCDLNMPTVYNSSTSIGSIITNANTVNTADYETIVLKNSANASANTTNGTSLQRKASEARSLVSASNLRYNGAAYTLPTTSPTCQ